MALSIDGPKRWTPWFGKSTAPCHCFLPTGRQDGKGWLKKKNPKTQPGRQCAFDLLEIRSQPGEWHDYPPWATKVCPLKNLRYPQWLATAVWGC